MHAIMFITLLYGKFNFARKESNELQQHRTKIVTTSTSIAQELEKIIS